LSFFAELKRRNVFRVGIAYAITAWLIAQIAGLAADSFGAPEWVMKMIITILMLGFPIAMVMAWAYEMTPEGLRRDDGDEAGQSENTTKLDRTIIIALVAALAYFAYDKFVLVPQTAPGNSTEIAQSALVETERSIAVLPFVNMSDDAGNEYFSEGLSEELLNLLVKIPELQVAARTSSFSYKGKDTQIAQIGEELHVAHVLEGSVRKSGNQVRITAQLIKADDGFHLWSETYDRTLDDIFVVQDEIAAAVVQALKVTMLGAKPEQRTTDPEAYSLYLQGKYFNDLSDTENLEKAVVALKKALAIDPGFAPAWMELQMSYSFLTRNRALPQQQGSELSMNALQKALELDPDNAIALAGLGYLKRSYEWDWAGAQEAINKAMLLEPNNAEVMGSAASIANTLGQRDRAIDLFERKIILDPLSLPSLRALSQSYNRVGRFTDAINLMERVLTINPNYPTARRDLSSIYMFMGDFEKALHELELAPPLPINDYYKANILFRAGRNIEARELFKLIKGSPANGFTLPMASLYVSSGDFDSAFEWLETAYQIREANLSFILNNKWLEDIRRDPRYPVFLEKMGLLEYWKAMPPEYGGPQK
jgi:adenylate cyclase